MITNESLQEKFEKLRAKKRDLAELKEIRTEDLDRNSEYAAAKEKISTNKEVQKRVALNYDQKNPGQREKIDDLAKQVKDLEETVSAMALAIIMEGGKPEVIVNKNGKRKTLRPAFKVSFKQQSLF